MYKTFVCIDFSLRSTGLAIMDHMENVAATHRITTKSGLSDHKTTDEIVGQVFDIVNENPHIGSIEDTLVVIEDYAMGRFQGKSFARAECVGALLWNFRQDSYPIIAVSPTTLKSYVAEGYTAGKAGKATKAEMQAAVHGITGNWYANDDINDAVALGLFANAVFTQGKKLTYRARTQMV